MSQNNIVNRFKKLNAGANASRISIQKMVPISETACRVLADYSGGSTENDLSKEITRAFGGKVRLAPGSAFAASETAAFLRPIDIIVKLNQTSKPFSDVETASFTSMGGNVFSDAEDNVWRVQGEGDNKLLVMVASEDLTDVLDARRSMNIATASVSYSMGEKYSAGDMIMFYDVERETASFGLAMEKENVVYCDETASFVAVKPEQVLVATNGTTVDEIAYQQPSTSASRQKLLKKGEDREPLNADNMMARHLEYMKELYAKRGDYFKKLEALIKDGYGRRAFG